MSKIILLSYPRSGNTWVRYIFEFLSKRPTQGYDHKTDAPLGKRVDIGVDLSAPPIAVKSHNELGGPDDKLLVVVRDYKEAITRHAKAGGWNTDQKLKEHFIQETSGKERAGVDYVKILQLYDEYEGDKLLVYYEDLIEKPKDTITKIVKWSCISDEYVHLLFENFEEHKKNSIKSYSPKSHSGGSNLKFHSSQLKPEFISFMTDHIKNKHPNVFDKYLKRYI